MAELGKGDSDQFFFLENMFLSIEARVEVWENEKCCGNTSRTETFASVAITR